MVDVKNTYITPNKLQSGDQYVEDTVLLLKVWKFTLPYLYSYISQRIFRYATHLYIVPVLSFSLESGLNPHPHHNQSFYVILSEFLTNKRKTKLTFSIDEPYTRPNKIFVFYTLVHSYSYTLRHVPIFLWNKILHDCKFPWIWYWVSGIIIKFLWT